VHVRIQGGKPCRKGYISRQQQEEEVQSSPNCIADLCLDLDLNDGLDLGPPATPTPNASEGVGKMFTRDEKVQRSSPLKNAVYEVTEDGWEVTSKVSLKSTPAPPSAAEIEAQAAKKLAETVWLAASSYSMHNIARQIGCWKKVVTPRSVSKPIFKSQRSGEMYNAVRTAVLA